MNDEELYNYNDVFGHLPAKYNRTFVVKERLDSWKRSEVTKTLKRNVGEHSTKVKKSMMKMAAVLYVLGFMGVFIQATDIVPGIPDRITFSVIVLALVAANLLQWKQAIKDREVNRLSLESIVKDHRKELSDINANMVALVRSNQEALERVFKELGKR